MSVEALQIENVRSIASASLELHPRRNLIWGPNGSGKTSLLESLYLIGRGRSFRTRHTDRLIRHGQDAMVVVGRTRDLGAHTIGFQCSRETGSIARVDGEAVVTFATLSVTCPTQVIDPSVHRLLEEGALRRRQWLDWTVFHVEPTFIDTWIRFSRVLKQRNAALRNAMETAGSWDKELSLLGESLTTARASVLERLNVLWRPLIERLVGLPIELSFARGWAKDTTLSDALVAGAARDRLRTTTSSGPHRADVHVRIGGRPATEVLSRGQQKLTAVALILCQLEFVQAVSGHSVQLLLDDAAAELDPESLLRFMRELSKLDAQQIWAGLVPDRSLLQGDGYLFHVEHGAVKTYNAPC